VYTVYFITIGSGVSIYAVIPCSALCRYPSNTKANPLLSKNKNKNKMEGLLFCRYMQGIALHIYGFSHAGFIRKRIPSHL
jgi:hypothetical protein